MVGVLAALVGVALGQGGPITIKAAVYEVGTAKLTLTGTRVSQRGRQMVFEGSDAASLESMIADRVKNQGMKLLTAPAVRTLDKQAATVSIGSGDRKDSLSFTAAQLGKGRVAVTFEASVTHPREGSKVGTVAWTAEAKSFLEPGKALVIKADGYPLASGKTGMVLIVIEAVFDGSSQRR